MFRDEYNYKIPFTLYWNHGIIISWDKPMFLADEEDVRPLFLYTMKELYDDLKNEKSNL